MPNSNHLSTTHQTVNLSNGQLALLMRHKAGRGELSPLPDLSGFEPAEGDRELLCTEGFLDPQGVPTPYWERVANVLTDPTVQVTAAVGNADGLGTIHGYGGRGEGVLVGYTAVGEGEHRINLSLEPGHLTGYLAKGLGLTAPVEPLGVAAELSQQALLAMAGLVDAAREQHLESLIARQPDEKIGVWPAAVLVSLRMATLSDDFRWLSGMVWRLLPLALELQEAEIRSGLDDLIALGWVAAEPSGSLVMTGDLDLACPHLSAPLAFGVLSVQRQGREDPERLHLGVVRTLGSVWMLDFIPGRPWKVRLASVAGLELARVIQNALEAVLKMEQPAEQSPSAPTPTLSSAYCPKCGQKAKPDDKFCINCGNRLR